ncbi:alpha-mannosidase [Cellulomonas xiejunii]|uniref:Alpha-mannosidase n=1 Tax=Cellulomonas xiejunii TaxID=2968083 RepID=A0ABY5KQN9_9CELL|nr:alpha-mannosidase [Cellulomonas xiejunii]MCC2319558.1 alpha-mannosidase [Cellulomonas xiejunii]UUI71496.1 alpha-mannosidase [Cellulomonas xiejunii]
MADLRVDAAAVAWFASAVQAHAGFVGAERAATRQALGSGIVQDALRNTSLVPTGLDLTLAEGA